MRLDNNFEIVTLNNNPLSGSLTENGYSITENTNNQFLMVGHSDSYIGSTGAIIYRTSQMGNWQASPTFGDSETDIARNVIVNCANGVTKE